MKYYVNVPNNLKYTILGWAFIIVLSSNPVWIQVIFFGWIRILSLDQNQSLYKPTNIRTRPYQMSSFPLLLLLMWFQVQLLLEKTCSVILSIFFLVSLFSCFRRSVWHCTATYFTRVIQIDPRQEFHWIFESFQNIDWYLATHIFIYLYLLNENTNEVS